MDRDRPRYVDDDAVAAEYGVCTRTVARWRAAGMPHVRLPGRGHQLRVVRYDPEAVRKWVDAHGAHGAGGAPTTPAPVARPRGRPRRSVPPLGGAGAR